ncbi:MipA/OmpV family protein [Pseudoalteromonas sp. OOF1S-7]|uniref:MipA/OmpV family protein n=1 Tax=Pseudoalteromonas sp. OOF1S-7 TaxID=2917757 RepID=UPI001EF6A55D|nr:MipA/OmpV family protein [Pseudoalteromonas sp. OOF1S-7]MCG7534937.1 MipA/OmpV family protein [Pseudoalteromonas sp. OOF1S-7]
MIGITKHTIAVAAGGLCLGLASLCSSASEQEQDDWDVKVGAGILVADLPWQGVDNEFALVPMAEIKKGKWFSNEDATIGYQFLNIQDVFSTYAGLGYRNEGYDSLFGDTSSSSKVFEGYDAPDGELVLNYGAKFLWFGLSGHTDLSDESDATNFTFSAEVPLYESANGFGISVQAQVRWLDADYVNTVYGISGKNINASVGRMAYQTDDNAVNVTFGLNAYYQLTPEMTLIGSVSRTELDDVISKSPLVGDDTMDVAFIGALYQF